jgi:BMFP domain-containing protein YqiC
MASDLLSTLKSYLSKVADGEHTPAELATSINTWIKESTESIKLKVEDEVQRSVSKMGFIKRAEFDELKKELNNVRGELNSLKGVKVASTSPKQKAPTKKSAVSATTSKPVKKKVVSTTSAKKSVAKKTAVKKSAKGK